MARLRSLQGGTQDVGPHASEVDCFFQVVLDEGGARLLHLSTFGSDERKSQSKSSQSIQLDEQMARRLLDVIHDVFPTLKT